jgi:hypothetical protein
MQKVSKGILAVVLSCCLVLVGCSTAWIQTAISDIPVIVQIITSILSLVSAAQGKGADPTMIAQVSNIGNQAKADLQLVQTLVTEYQAAAATAKPGLLSQIDTAISTAQQNLNQILVAFHVNDPALAATISGSVGLALATLLEIQSLIPPPPTAAKARLGVSAKALKPRTATQLRAEFNFLVTSNGFPSAAI